jgi:hypothetical protein
MIKENLDKLFEDFDKSFKPHVPKEYKGPLPFDRFGEFGHKFYVPEHSGRYGHYCSDWDGLYICEDCEEFKSCGCFDNLKLTEQDKIWAEEIGPELTNIVYNCAKAKIPIDFKFTITNTGDNMETYKIHITLDENQNYSYRLTK